MKKKEEHSFLNKLPIEIWHLMLKESPLGVFVNLCVTCKFLWKISYDLSVRGLCSAGVKSSALLEAFVNGSLSETKILEIHKWAKEVCAKTLESITPNEEEISKLHQYLKCLDIQILKKGAEISEVTCLKSYLLSDYGSVMWVNLEKLQHQYRALVKMFLNPHGISVLFKKMDLSVQKLLNEMRCEEYLSDTAPHNFFKALFYAGTLTDSVPDLEDYFLPAEIKEMKLNTTHRSLKEAIEVLVKHYSLDFKNIHTLSFLDEMGSIIGSSFFSNLGLLLLQLMNGISEDAVKALKLSDLNNLIFSVGAIVISRESEEFLKRDDLTRHLISLKKLPLRGGPSFLKMENINNKNRLLIIIRNNPGLLNVVKITQLMGMPKYFLKSPINKNFEFLLRQGFFSIKVQKLFDRCALNWEGEDVKEKGFTLQNNDNLLQRYHKSTPTKIKEIMARLTKLVKKDQVKLAPKPPTQLENTTLPESKSNITVINKEKDTSSKIEKTDPTFRIDNVPTHRNIPNGVPNYPSSEFLNSSANLSQRVNIPWSTSKDRGSAPLLYNSMVYQGGRCPSNFALVPGQQIGHNPYFNVPSTQFPQFIPQNQGGNTNNIPPSYNLMVYQGGSYPSNFILVPGQQIGHNPYSKVLPSQFPQFIPPNPENNTNNISSPSERSPSSPLVRGSFWRTNQNFPPNNSNFSPNGPNTGTRGNNC